MEQAYALGVMAGKKAAENRDAVASKGDPKKSRKGSVNYGYEGQALDKSKLKISQRVGVDWTERLAKKYGMTTYFYRSYVNENGERVYKNKEGKIVPADESGHYDPSDGSIHIDLNCGDMGDSVMFTIAHELTHFIQDWSPTRYRKLCSILMDGFAQSNQSVKQLILHKQNEYRKKGVELTAEQAYDEVIASSMEGVLTDGRVMDLLDQVETIDQSLRDQIKSFFENVVDMIRDTVQAYKNKKPDSPEGRIVQRMDHLREQLQNAFAIGLSEGGYNYQRGGGINTASKSGAQYALRCFEDGLRFVDVQMDPSIFMNMSIEDMNRKAKEILMEKFAGQVIGIDNRVFVNGDSVNEYIHPSKNIERDIREAKLVAGSELDNLLDAGTPLPNESDGKDGHVHPDVIDFSYFKTIFKVGNEYFEGIVNIENIKRGKLLKDITKIRNITKDIVSSYGQNPKSNFLRDASMHSIRNSNEKVNKKSVRYQMNAAAQEHLQAVTGDMGADVDALKQLISMLNKQTGMNRLKHGTLDAAASFLMRTAGARGDKQQLMRMLHEFYSYVGQTEGLSWESIQQEARPIAQWLTDHMVRTKQMSEYAAEVLDTVRHSRIYLDDAQRKDVEYTLPTSSGRTMTD